MWGFRILKPLNGTCIGVCIRESVIKDGTGGDFFEHRDFNSDDLIAIFLFKPAPDWTLTFWGCKKQDLLTFSDLFN